MPVSTALRTRIAGSLLLGSALLAVPSTAQAALPTTTGPTGACSDPQGVTVVVDLTDLGGQVEVGCATGTGTGTEALAAAGFTETRDASGLICAIGGLPDPCPTSFEGVYWSYWHAEAGGAWESSMEGSDTAVVEPGQVEGWRYSDGTAGPTIDPPAAAEQTVAGEASAADDAVPADDATATAADGAEPPVGVDPLLLAGLAVLAVLAVVAVVLSRRRSTFGPAGQD